jgi:hypothetical protein
LGVDEAGAPGAGRKYAGGLPVAKRTVHPNPCGMNALRTSEKGYTGTARAGACDTQRNPRWQVEVSMGCAIRAAGR